jgi:hypothetical protein
MALVMPRKAVTQPLMPSRLQGLMRLEALAQTQIRAKLVRAPPAVSNLAFRELADIVCRQPLVTFTRSVFQAKAIYYLDLPPGITDQFLFLQVARSNSALVEWNRTPYTCMRFGKLLKGYGIRASMGNVGACWDDTVVARFFGSLIKRHVSAIWSLANPGKSKSRDCCTART